VNGAPQQTALTGHGDGVTALADAECAVDAAHMSRHGIDRDEQQLGDLLDCPHRRQLGLPADLRDALALITSPKVRTDTRGAPTPVETRPLKDWD
jgi:hypothetical protein